MSQPIYDRAGPNTEIMPDNNSYNWRGVLIMCHYYGIRSYLIPIYVMRSIGLFILLHVDRHILLPRYMRYMNMFRVGTTSNYVGWY